MNNKLACEKGYRLTAAKHGFWAIPTQQLTSEPATYWSEICNSFVRIKSSINWTTIGFFIFLYIISFQIEHGKYFSFYSHVTALLLSVSSAFLFISAYIAYVIFWAVLEHLAWKHHRAEPSSIINLDFVLQPSMHRWIAILAGTVAFLITVIAGSLPYRLFHLIH